MLEQLKPQAPDKILMLVQMFRDDPRSDKIDLGVGVYKTAEGLTPIMRSVKAAEKLLWETETTKSYTGLAGDPAYGAAMRDMILAGAVSNDRVSAAATPGGTGAIRQPWCSVAPEPQGTRFTSLPGTTITRRGA